MGSLVRVVLSGRIIEVLGACFQGVAQASIQFAIAPSGLAFRMLGMRGVDQSGQFCENFGRCCMPGRELLHRLGFLEQPFAPVLGCMHDRNLVAMARAIGRQRIAQRTGVDLAHQPADVLALPAQSATRVADALREFYRIDQLRRDRQVTQLGRLQLQQPLPKLLQLLHLPLELGLAGFVAPRRRIALEFGFFVLRAIGGGIRARACSRCMLARMQVRPGGLMRLRTGLAARCGRMMA
jgi:hypothetical protein